MCKKSKLFEEGHFLVKNDDPIFNSLLKIGRIYYLEKRFNILMLDAFHVDMSVFWFSQLCYVTKNTILLLDLLLKVYDQKKDTHSYIKPLIVCIALQCKGREVPDFVKCKIPIVFKKLNEYHQNVVARSIINKLSMLVNSNVAGKLIQINE